MRTKATKEPAKLYRYTISGTAAGGQTWQAAGTLEINPGNFALALDKAMQFAFDKLTSGNAVFGKPDEGCVGPYHVTRYLLERDFL